MRRLRVRDKQQGLHPQFAIPAFVAALIALGLALPGAASAANPTFSVNTTSGNGEGEVECTIQEPGEEPLEEELCDGPYPANTKITVFAEPEEHSEFVGFRNGTGSAAAPGKCSNKACSFTLTENSTVEAVFDLEEFAFSVDTTSGTGEGAVECEVEGTPEPCAEKYPYETVLILVAKANGESAFTGWEGCEDPEFPDEGECELAIEKATTVKAIFTSTAEYALTVQVSGPGSVTCAPTCSGKLLKGTKVTLTAHPAKGSVFAGWAGGGCKGIAPCTVTMDADKTVAAEFEPIPPPDPEDELLEVEEGTASAAGAARVKAGKAGLKLTCSEDGPCKGTLQLTAKVKQGKKAKSLVIGKASFKLDAGSSETLKVKLSGPAKQELAKVKTLKAKVSGTDIAASTVTLALAKKKH